MKLPVICQHTQFTRAIAPLQVNLSSNISKQGATKPNLAATFENTYEF